MSAVSRPGGKRACVPKLIPAIVPGRRVRSLDPAQALCHTCPMRFGPPLDLDEVVDHKRIIQSIAGAALIASVGFAFLFLLFGYLPTLGLAWAEHHPRAVGALLSPSGKSPIRLFMLLFSVAMPPLGALTGMLISRKLRYNPVNAAHPL